MKSWKTTVAGLLAALGTAVLALPENSPLRIVGLILAIIGTAALGITARDNDLTSEDVGAGAGRVPPAPPSIPPEPIAADSVPAKPPTTNIGTMLGAIPLLLWVASSLLISMSCTRQQQVQAVEVGVPAACTLIDIIDGEEKIGELCEDLAPLVPHILAARRARMAPGDGGAELPPVPGCPVCECP